MIRTLIVHEVRLVAELIGDVLREQAEFEVVGYATTPAEALAKLDSTCAVALVSANLPGDGALDFVRTVAKSSPSTRLVVMGLGDSENEILESIESGAVGYVLKQESMDDLVERVRAAYAGQAVLSPHIAGALIERMSALTVRCNGAKVHPDQLAELTPREREVLGLIADGLTNQEISARLVIELGTVKNHVHNILRKLDVGNRYRAAELLTRVQEQP